MKELIHPKFRYTKAEIVFIVRHEMPLEIEDVLARRTRALFLDANASFEAAETVASIMATELGLDVEWEKKQLENYHELLKFYSIH
jgi:glycerol-3-phosphate dehydrogenase